MPKAETCENCGRDLPRSEICGRCGHNNHRKRINNRSTLRIQNEILEERKIRGKDNG